MAVIPIAQRLADIETQANRLKRRIGNMEEDRDFLIDTIIDRPIKKTEPQWRLVKVWEEEIGRMKADLQFLRTEWSRLNAINKRNKSSKNQRV